MTIHFCFGLSGFRCVIEENGLKIFRSNIEWHSTAAVKTSGQQQQQKGQVGGILWLLAQNGFKAFEKLLQDHSL